MQYNLDFAKYVARRAARAFPGVHEADMASVILYEDKAIVIRINGMDGYVNYTLTYKKTGRSECHRTLDGIYMAVEREYAKETA